MEFKELIEARRSVRKYVPGDKVPLKFKPGTHHFAVTGGYTSCGWMTPQYR